jgi:molybdopterin converting factor small subunit
MEPGSAVRPQSETYVTVRYWASARAASGVDEDRIAVSGAISLAEVRERALALHPDADRLPDVVKACSVLVDDTPVNRLDPGEVMVGPGMSVEFLPPFAGG